MLRVVKGDITSVTQGLILQQVNAQGVMGSGVAKAIRDKWPVVYEKYKRHVDCYSNRADSMGDLHIVLVAPGLYVGNMVGQLSYGRDKSVRYTSYDALDEALRDLRTRLELKPMHVHYPMFGCGLGNGNWDVVQRLIQQHIGEFEQTLWLQ